MNVLHATWMRRGALWLAWAAAFAASAWMYVAWVLPVPPGVEAYANTAGYPLMVFGVFISPFWVLLLTVAVVSRRSPRQPDGDGR